MKVGLVHFLLEPVVGAGMAVKSAAVSRALSAEGLGVRLITTDVGLLERSAPALPGVDVVILPTWFRRFPVPLVAPSSLGRLVRGLDAVLFMNHWNALNAMAASAARREGVPFGLCPGGALEVQGRSQSLKRAYNTVVGRRLFRDAVVLVATTPLEARQFESYGIPPAKIAVIPNGVDVDPDGGDPASFSQRHGLPAADPFVLFMGRFNRIKGPDLLLEAFGQAQPHIQRSHLVFAGRDEGMEADLRRRARELDLADRVHFVGHLDLSQSVAAYRAAALLAVPSRHEAMSQVALEAGVQRTPVLLTTACGFDEVARIGGGAVVEATVDGLANGMRLLLTSEAGLRAMGQRLHDHVVAEFGWPRIARRYIEMFETISGRQPADDRR